MPNFYDCKNLCHYFPPLLTKNHLYQGSYDMPKMRVLPFDMLCVPISFVSSWTTKLQFYSSICVCDHYLYSASYFFGYYLYLFSSPFGSLSMAVVFALVCEEIATYPSHSFYHLDHMKLRVEIERLRRWPCVFANTC